MALFHCNFFSADLKISTGANVILPDGIIEGKLPVLYLFHGYTDDYTIWQRRTSLELYASRYCLAIVMPDVQKSFYSDYAGINSGYKYWSYISDELPRLMRGFFNLSDKRSDNFAAGLSMGGFGAFKLGLNCPDKFAAVASLSGAVDSLALGEHNVTEAREHEILLGSSDLNCLRGGINDLVHVAEQLAKSGKPRPKLFQCCGTEDFLYRDNIRVRDKLKEFNFDLTYEEGSGDHNWQYWNMMIEKVLAWLPIDDTCEK